MIDKIKMAIYQMEVKADIFEPDFKDENLEKVEKFISENSECDIVLLPDDFYAGYGYGVMNLPDFSHTSRMEFLSELAVKYNIYIAGSTLFFPQKPCGLKSESRAFLIDPAGKVVASQQRNNIQKKELEWVLTHDEVEVFDTALGKIGFIINFDTVFPEIWNKLISAGVEIIINPMLYIPHSESVKDFNLPVDYIDMPLLTKNMQQAFAVSGNCYVVSASAVGSYAQAEEFNCVGQSRIVYPNGVVKEIEDVNESSLIVEIDAETLTNSRAAMGRRFSETKVMV